MLEFRFNPEKTLDAIAFLLSKSPSKELGVLHLIKMLYFADRECLKEYSFPITGDRLSSLPYGPVVSRTYDILKSPSMEEPFSAYLEKKSKKIILKQERKIGKLSEAEEDVLEFIHRKFAHFTVAKLIDYGHNPVFVPEWSDPGNSSIPIDVEDLLSILGKSAEEIRGIKEIVREQNQVQSFLKKYEA